MRGKSDFDSLRKDLDRFWAEALAYDALGEIPSAQVDAIEQVFTSSTKAYAHALITQLLAKLNDPIRDARCIQRIKGLDDPRRFDARSICAKVVVPWERSIGSPLTMSTDPYVSNSLRIQQFSVEHRESQREKKGWDALLSLLDACEQDISIARRCMLAVLLRVRALRDRLSIAYPNPQRASLQDTLLAIERFLETPSGGARLQVATYAVFDAMRSAWGLFDEVITAPVNSSDRASGNAGDVICMKSGAVVMACEAKDRDLSLELLEDAIKKARLKHVRELFALVRGKVAANDEEFATRIDREFKHGMNVYTFEANAFLALCLALLGEPGRRAFLQAMASGLDLMHQPFETKREWAVILARF